MNREPLSCTHAPYRGIVPGSAEHKQQVDAWVARLLSRDECVPAGHVFQWSRDHAVHNTAYLFDAVMCSLQYAQMQLQKASTCAGKQSYLAATDAAKTYAFIINDMLPQWTFRPAEVHKLPDTSAHDIYGHYCLARAVAYHAIGKADLTCTDSAKDAASANAAHMFLVAAQLIDGDVSTMINTAEACVADVLVSRGQQFLEAWDSDNDPEGAAKGLACYAEAHKRYLNAEMHGCQDKIDYATARNQVHWLEPVLPAFASLVRPRITALR